MTDTLAHLTLDEITVAWMQVGPPSPSPLVFLHGLGDSAIMTMGEIARHPVLKNRTSFLIDLPGFGHSTAPASWPARMEDHVETLVATFDALGMRNVTVVGHSMGGSLALLLAARLPHRISSLILAEPLLVREQSQLAKAIVRRSEPDFVARGYDLLLRATRRQAARGELAARAFLGPVRHADPSILYRSATSLLTYRSPSYLDLLRILSIPRTLLVGEFTRADVTLVPKSVRWGEIPHAGHAMASENPEAFAHAIASAIR